MSKFQELSTLIWSVADDVLRGLFKPHEYGDVILPFVILRRLDCVIEPRKDEIYTLYEEYKTKVEDPSPVIRSRIKAEFYNTSKYDLSRLKQDPKNVFINFRNYINGFSKNVYDIIEHFQLDKPVEKLHKNNRLFLLVEKFSSVDLHPDVVDNHAMGQIFEELLRKFSEMSNETSGEHYTPRDIVKLLVSLVFSGDREDLQGKGKIRSVYDPCCGTDGMLTIGKSYLLISGENPDHTRLGSSLSEGRFFNTGIITYIWILCNSKKAQRKAKIQLINARGLFKPMKKSIGNKRMEICSEQQQLIVDRKYKDRKLPARLRTHPPGHRHRAVLKARNKTTSAQQLDGPQRRQNRVRDQLHEILFQTQTPALCRSNHQRPARYEEGE
jgi:type I restriction-modification system DNA methylase subunit